MRHWLRWACWSLATLAQHAGAVVVRLEDEHLERVLTRGVLPRWVTRGVDFYAESGPLLACGADAEIRGVGSGASWGSQKSEIATANKESHRRDSNARPSGY